MLLKSLVIFFINLISISYLHAYAGASNNSSFLSDPLLIAGNILLVSLVVFLIWVYLDKKKQNKLLLESEERFRTLLESTAAIPWEFELSTFLFTYIGPQIEDVTGYKPEEWYVKNFWSDHVHSSDRKLSSLFSSEEIEYKEDYEFSCRFIKKDGSVVWVRNTIKVIFEEGEPALLCGFMFNINKQISVQENKEKIEYRLAQAQNIAHIGSWDFDLVSNDLQWSEETYRIFEFDPLVYTPLFETFMALVHPDDREKATQAYVKSLKNTSVDNYLDHRLLMPDGRIKYVHVQSDTDHNAEGMAIRSYGTIQDITDRKRTDEAIKAIASTVSSSSHNGFYENVVMSMAEMFCADYAFIGLIDEKDHSRVNTYTVYSQGNIIQNFSYSLSNTPCMNVVAKAACSYPKNVQQLFPNDPLLVSLAVESYIGLPLYSENGNVVGLIVVMDTKPMKNTSRMREVLKIFAARIESELERKKSHQIIQQLSLAVEQSPNAIIITNAKGNIEYINPAFLNITGYRLEEVLNKNPSIIKSEEMDESFYKELWQTIQSGKTWSGVFHNKRQNGELYWDEAKISPIKNAQGEITHYLGIHSDITDKKEMEQQLRRSQKMDALGKLTGGIAHDYNNMLSIILGYSELLEMVLNDESDKKAKGFLRQIQRATERGATLTKKLLAFSRPNATEPENVDINQLLLDSQNMLEKTLTARVKLIYQLADIIWPIYLDKGDLEDAILNMCINAMHAMPNGGELTLATYNRNLMSDEAAVIDIPAGEYVQLSISDNGCGINEETLNQVFDPFFTTKGELGTGLGLTQVYGFIKRAKGAITIDSSLDQGTYIVIYLPRLGSFSEQSHSILDLDIEQTGTENILVVDDEEVICELSKSLLESNGYNVIVAEDGESALKALESNDIDLVLSDVIMPNMDGYKLASKIRKKYPHIKIQLVSGYDDDCKQTEEDQLLYKYLLPKPFTASSLFNAVKKCLMRE